MGSGQRERRHRVAVVGGGYWGKNLLRCFHALGALSLVCDKNGELFDRVRKACPGVETCLAYSQVLGREDLDAVVIATPAETHFALAREALLAGKHVFVEKPLALEAPEGEALVALAEKNGLTLMVGHLLQYHPAFVRLKELALSGELGRINYIYSNRLNLGKIRREENILWSFAPHDISMILSLAGELPEAVWTLGGNFLHRRIADVTVTHLAFAAGLKAHIYVSWLHPFKEQKLVVVGERKMAVFDDTRPWPDKVLLYPHEITWHDHVPVAARAQAERVEIAEDEPLLLECRHFLDRLADKAPPLTDGREGLRVLRVLSAGQRSLDRQGACIRLAPQAETSPEPAAGTGKPEQPAAPAYSAHPTAVVDEGADIGPGTRIWHFSHILPGSRIGAGCTIGQNVMIGPDVTVGRGCKIQNNVCVYKGVTLEDEVFCGPSMVFTNVYNPRAFIRRMDEARETRVGRGATLGANCTIVCGNPIGRYAFVAAGAVVTAAVPDHALAAGNPARVKGWVCRCGVRLSFEDGLAACGACGLRYRQGGAPGEPAVACLNPAT